MSDASDWSDGVGGNFSHLFMSGLLHQGGVARKSKVWGHWVPEIRPVGGGILAGFVLFLTENLAEWAVRIGKVS